MLKTAWQSNISLVTTDRNKSMYGNRNEHARRRHKTYVNET
jgi:hypothetical protein